MKKFPLLAIITGLLIMSSIMAYTLTIMALNNTSVVYGLYIKDTLQINESFEEKILISSDEIYTRLFALDEAITKETNEEKRNYLIVQYNEESERVAIINDAFFDRKKAYTWTSKMQPSIKNIHYATVTELFTFESDNELLIEKTYFVSRLSEKAELEKAITDISLIKNALPESQKRQEYENVLVKLSAEKTELDTKNIEVRIQ